MATKKGAGKKGAAKKGGAKKGAAKKAAAKKGAAKKGAAKKGGKLSLSKQAVGGRKGGTAAIRPTTVSTSSKCVCVA